MRDWTYDLIIASASRPRLLRETLVTVREFADMQPIRAIVHDDAAFPGREHEVRGIVDDVFGDRTPVLYHHDDPPIRHGPALKWLLDRVETEFVLYTQDDHQVIRPLPIHQALAVMQAYDLNQIRFNKRDTGPWKETWKGRWYKIPVDFALGDERITLTISDHWYFQTSLWRVAAIKPIVDWFMDDMHEGAWFSEHCEQKINNALNGNVERFPRGLVPLPPDSLTPDQRERDQDVRATYQKTFIWGGIDEKSFVRHIGNKPEDWALPHPREAYDGR